MSAVTQSARVSGIRPYFKAGSDVLLMGLGNGLTLIRIELLLLELLR